jgi:hypothetical protein
LGYDRFTVPFFHHQLLIVVLIHGETVIPFHGETVIPSLKNHGETVIHPIDKNIDRTIVGAAPAVENTPASELYGIRPFGLILCLFLKGPAPGQERPAH